MTISPHLVGVIPVVVQVHLVGRGPGPLSFQGGGVVRCGALSDTIGCSLFKGRLHIFPLNTAAVVGRVITNATATLGLLPRGRTPTEEVAAPTRDVPGRLSAVSLRVSEVLSALALQWALWSHIRVHRHSQAAEFGN